MRDTESFREAVTLISTETQRLMGSGPRSTEHFSVGVLLDSAERHHRVLTGRRKKDLQLSVSSNFWLMQAMEK